MDPVAIDRLNRNDGPRRDVALDVGVARKVLVEARSELDLAMAALPDAGGNEVMATPALLSLLIGAVTAKDYLSKLEKTLLVGAADEITMTKTTSTGRILG